MKQSQFINSLVHQFINSSINMKPYIIIILSLISIVNGQAQQNGQKPDKAVEKYINKGLRAYNKADYREAELDFRKALAIDPVNAVASYNLGLTQTELDKNLEAAHYFEKAAKQADDPLLKSKAYFNQGNVWFNKKKYDKAVEAYKNALRQNPSDEEARYNLALAQQKLKQQQKKNKNKKNQKNKQQNKQKKNQQNKDQKNKNQKNKKDQNKQGQNKKDQQKNKNGQNKKNQNKQNKKDQNKKGKGDKKKDQNKQGKYQKDKGKQDQNQEKQKQQGGQKGQKQQEKQGQGQKRKAQLTPQQVKQILVALKNKEQKTQKKIKAKILKGSSKKRKQDKDW